MNLAQIRVAVRDILTAGSGKNTAISEDDFWSDSEINTYINKAQDELYKIIRRARADYFTRILRSTDSPFYVRGFRFAPSGLTWVVGQGNYSLPPDFVRMKMITDLSTDRVRLMASDISKSDLRILMNEEADESAYSYLYDLIGSRTLVIRPIPRSVREFEFIYEKSLPLLRDWTTGSVTVATDSTTATFSAGINIQNQFLPGDELMVGSAVSTQVTPDPNETYPTIKSLDSQTVATLEAPYAGANATSFIFRVSSVPEIPVAHHHMLIAYAASQGFKKGTNPHVESSEMWRADFDSMIPSLVNDVESRQGSDIETVQAYLEEEYD